MENLFDILIILFIIYALLAPILRRKPPVPQKPAPDYSEDDFEYKEEKSSQEILREVEELFGYSSKKSEEATTQVDEEFRFPESSTLKVEKSETQTQFKQISEKEEKFSHQVVSLHPEMEPYDYEGTLQDIEIDQFDYSKIDEFNNDKDVDSNLSAVEKTFSIQLENIDDFKKAFIYREIFDLPIALRMRRIKWQRNIF
jgi:hypothetical protein